MIRDYYRYTTKTVSGDKFKNSIVLEKIEFVENQKGSAFLLLKISKIRGWWSLSFQKDSWAGTVTRAEIWIFSGLKSRGTIIFNIIC